MTISSSRQEQEGDHEVPQLRHIHRQWAQIRQQIRPITSLLSRRRPLQEEQYAHTLPHLLRDTYVLSVGDNQNAIGGAGGGDSLANVLEVALGSDSTVFLANVVAAAAALTASSGTSTLFTIITIITLPLQHNYPYPTISPSSASSSPSSPSPSSVCYAVMPLLSSIAVSIISSARLC